MFPHTPAARPWSQDRRGSVGCFLRNTWTGTGFGNVGSSLFQLFSLERLLGATLPLRGEINRDMLRPASPEHIPVYLSIGKRLHALYPTTNDITA